MKHPIVLGLMIALALIPQTSHALPQKPAEPKTEAKPAARNATATTNVADETATPLTEPLKDGAETRITCIYKGTGKSAALSGAYHYRLWVPEGYSADPKKTWKTIFIADPNGKAKLGAMGDWIKKHGYIAVMLEESKNGPYEPNIVNFLTAHADVLKRMRVAEGKKVATGFSGGARACSLFVTLVPGFGGLIFQGAGCSDMNPLDRSYIVKDIKVKTLAGTFGKKDMNYDNAARLKKAFGSRITIFEFDGGHQWAPQEIIEQALSEVDAKLPK
jgi:hypothetical protein